MADQSIPRQLNFVLVMHRQSAFLSKQPCMMKVYVNGSVRKKQSRCENVINNMRKHTANKMLRRKEEVGDRNKFV